MLTRASYRHAGAVGEGAPFSDCELVPGPVPDRSSRSGPGPDTGSAVVVVKNRVVPPQQGRVLNQPFVFIDAQLDATLGGAPCSLYATREVVFP